ncbi:MAG: SET domain-containing protein-lysine N-methyltransferase [Bacteroidota bacterium]
MDEKKISQIKSKILSHLKNEVYCQLKASPIHGIGVFAIREIPSGINPMQMMKKHREIRLSREDLGDLSPAIMAQLERFCYCDDDGALVSTMGLNTMSFLVYVNHSKMPNITLMTDGSARALRQIEAGEELTINYDKEFGEEHDFTQ